MKKAIFLFSALLIFATSTPAFSLEKREFTFQGALGADVPIDEGDGKVIPIIYGSYITYFGQNIYNDTFLTTTTFSTKTGYDTGTYHIGFQPILAHSIEGGFRHYDQGILDEDKHIDGNYVGTIFFIDYRIIEDRLITQFRYRPSYYFYDFMPNDSEIEMPSSHWAHVGSTELIYQNLVETNLGIIKHGYQVKTKYELMRRVGYGTYEVYDSDIDQSHKFYADLGMYYNFPGDYNLLFDIRSAYHIDVDRNNAERIGSLTVQHANMPGYYNSEFRHDRYIMGRMQFGIPFGDRWETRVQPGFNILYMPENNKVIGQEDYPKTTYRSVSLSLSTRIAGVLPLFVNYAYGIDAERRDEPDARVSEGSHEIMVLTVFGFGSPDN